MNIKEFMYKFFSTRSRVTRFNYTIYTVIIVFLGTFFSSKDANEIPILIQLLFIIFFIKYTTTLIKRLHDLNLNGFWCVFFFMIPPTLFTLCFFKGTPTTNKYDESPTD